MRHKALQDLVHQSGSQERLECLGELEFSVPSSGAASRRYTDFWGLPYIMHPGVHMIIIRVKKSIAPQVIGSNTMYTTTAEEGYHTHGKASDLLSVWGGFVGIIHTETAVPAETKRT